MIIKHGGFLNKIMDGIRRSGDDSHVFSIDTENKLFAATKTVRFDEIKSITLQYYQNKGKAIKAKPDVDYGIPAAIIYSCDYGSFCYVKNDRLIVLELFKALSNHNYEIRTIISGHA